LSLKKGSVEVRLQESILRHWEAENCLHLETDKESGEDKHVFRNAALGKVWTFLTGMAGAVVRLTKKEEGTLREVREQLRAKPQNARQM
jgi:predicted transposase YbfD/YdcC